jgi:hypothetical protein
MKDFGGNISVKSVENCGGIFVCGFSKQKVWIIKTERQDKQLFVCKKRGSRLFNQP